MKRYFVGVIIALAFVSILASACHGQEQAPLKARYLGSSSQGGFLIKCDDPDRVQVDEMLTVIRDGIAIGHIVVRSTRIDGTTQVSALFNDANMKSSDGYVRGRIEPGQRVTLTAPSLGAYAAAPSPGDGKKFLEGRLLGASSNGGFLIKFDNPRVVKSGDFLVVLRGETAVGELQIVNANTDGTVTAIPNFQGDLATTDRYLLSPKVLGSNQQLNLATQVDNQGGSGDGERPVYSGTRKIRYRVSGTLDRANIVWRPVEGGVQTRTNATLPWEATFDAKAGTYLQIGASADDRNQPGVLQVEIYVDGRLLRAQNSGPSAVDPRTVLSEAMP